MLPEQLAEYAQVDIRTARRWISENRVPWITAKTWEDLRNGKFLHGQFAEWSCCGNIIYSPAGDKFSPGQILQCHFIRQMRAYQELQFSARH